jgi:putative restriction endonuclease
MAQLSSDRLTKLLLSALPGAREEPSPNAPKPVILNIPNLGRIRFYLWTTTPDASRTGRPLGEHKSQIIIPGTDRGSKQHLDLGDIPTFILGYSPFYGVFVAWQADRHQDSGYSKNLQVKADLLEEASRSGWAIDAPRRTDAGREVRAAIYPSHLARFLRLSIEADALRRDGEERTSFLLAGAPDLDALDLRARSEAGEKLPLADVERARVAATGTRLVREAGFSKQVLDSYGHKCAVCEVQLSVLEGAHIIPVHDPKGTDEVWNGLALCRNHHRLYDRRILLIDQNAVVRANDETLQVLRELGRLGGYEPTIGIHRDKRLKSLPNFYGTNAGLKRQMRDALSHTFNQTPA